MTLSTSQEPPVEGDIVVSNVPKEEEISYIMTEPLSGKPRVKQGHKCCGGCCDVRRATIIVNKISAILSVCNAFTFYQLYNSGQQTTTYGLKAVVLPTLFLWIWSVVQVLMYSAGAIGGVSYSTWLVGLAVFEYILDFVIYGITFDVGDAIMSALFAYPNIVFILEVRKGIMSKENYHNEQQSCCCV